MADIKTRDAVKGTIKTIDKAAIASERSIRPDDPVAGHNNADGVVVIRPAHSPHGLGIPDAPGLLAVGNGFAIGDGLQSVPAFHAEGGTTQADG